MVETVDDVFPDAADGNGVGAKDSNRRDGPFAASFWRRRLPPLRWLPRYDARRDLLPDLVAGVTVGITVIPEGMTYAVLGNLPPQYGLYAAVMPPLCYALLGNCRQLVIGPTGIMGMMVASLAVRNHGYAATVALLNGLAILLCAVLRLGFLVEFFSAPVISAFVSAAAIAIPASQLKHLLGIEVTTKSQFPGLIGVVHELVLNGDTFRWADCVLGCSCIAFLQIFKVLSTVDCFGESPSSKFAPCRSLPASARAPVAKTLWFLSIARNALAVGLCGAAAYVAGGGVFRLTDTTEAALPDVAPPPFSVQVNADAGDDEQQAVDGFLDMVGNVGALVVVLPVVSILQHMAIVKAFAGNEPVDATQELLALGTGNLLGSFLSGMPITGSFSRSAVNAASGVRSTGAGAVASAVVLVAMACLVPAFAFIPKASLAAVIICAMVFGVDAAKAVSIWRSNRIDIVPFAVTFLVGLFWKLDYGLLLGLAVDLLLVIGFASKPRISLRRKECPTPGKSLWWAAPDRSVLFPSVSALRLRLTEGVPLETTAEGKNGGGNGKTDKADVGQVHIVVDCHKMARLDYTSADGILSLAKELHVLHHGSCRLVLYRLPSGPRETMATLCSQASPGNLLLIDNLPELRSAIMKAPALESV